MQQSEFFAVSDLKMHIRKIAIAKEQYLEIYVFVPCIVIQLCNVNQQNASFF